MKKLLFSTLLSVVLLNAYNPQHDFKNKFTSNQEEFEQQCIECIKKYPKLENASIGDINAGMVATKLVEKSVKQLGNLSSIREIEEFFEFIGGALSQQHLQEIFEQCDGDEEVFKNLIIENIKNDRECALLIKKRNAKKNETSTPKAQ